MRLFLSLKQNKDIKNSVSLLTQVFNKISQFSGLKLNKSKCEIAPTGILKSVKVVLCGMKCINLKESMTKVLGIHYFYNKIIENEDNFRKHIAKIESVLKLWRLRTLTLEVRITIFKTLALSKIIQNNLKCNN